MNLVYNNQDLGVFIMLQKIRIAILYFLIFISFFSITSFYNRVKSELKNKQVNVAINGNLASISTGVRYFPESKNDSFDEASMDKALKEGQNIIPIIKPTIKDDKYIEKLRYLIKKYSINQIAFYSERNYQNDFLTRDLINLFRDESIIISLVEDTEQRSFLYKNDFEKALLSNEISVNRALLIRSNDVLNLSSNELSLRIFRAIVDRNITTVLLPMDLTASNLNLYRDAINDLSSVLEKHGFELSGDITNIEPYKSKEYTEYLLLVLQMFLILFLCSYFTHISQKKVIFITFMVLSFFIIVKLILGTVLYKQMIALGYSILFPCISTIVLVKLAQKELFMLPNILRGVIFSTLILCANLLGGFIIALCQMDIGFRVSLYPFDFALATYIAPLLIIILWERKIAPNNEYLKKLFQNKKLSTVAILLTFVLVYIYLSRSGNITLLPASRLELDIRMYLERFLGVRPRTKEFLIGYPCIFLLPTAIKSKNQVLRLITILGTTITGISINNSFCHGFTLFITSSERAINGFLIGIIFSIIVTSLIKTTETILDKKSFQIKRYINR